MPNYDLTLYLDVNKSPLANPIVYSGGNGMTNDEQLTFVYGDTLKTLVALTEGTTVSTVYNASGYSITMSLGTKGGSSPYVAQSTWYRDIGNGFTSSFALSGSALLASLGTNDFGTYTLQAVLTPTQSSYRKTILLKDITLFNPVDA